MAAELTSRAAWAGAPPSPCACPPVRKQRRLSNAPARRPLNEVLFPGPRRLREGSKCSAPGELTLQALAELEIVHLHRMSRRLAVGIVRMGELASNGGVDVRRPLPLSLDGLGHQAPLHLGQRPNAAQRLESPMKKRSWYLG